MTTVLECIDSGTRYLEKKGIEDARRNMQILVAHHLQCTRMQLYLRFDEPLGENILAPLRIDLKKRGERTPLQHLIGTVHFHNHDFKTDARALIPRPETEELVAILCNQVSPTPATILDVGCGSGVIGISLALAWPESQVTLADISADALALSNENITTLNAPNARTIQSDLFSALTDQRFHLIVANLPYIAESDCSTLAPEVLCDPRLALFSGADGLDLIRKFCAQVKNFLHPNGVVAMEIGIHQDQAVSELLHAAGLTEIKVLQDLCGIPRFPLAKSPN